MSENDRSYVDKMKELQVARLENRPPNRKVVELLRSVRECEAARDLRDQVARTGEDN